MKQLCACLSVYELWTWFESIGHSLKNWAPLRKLFAHPGVPSWLRAC